MEVYWIGGVICSGKSTLARLLAGGYGWTHYETDAHFERHALQANIGWQPTMLAFQHDKALGRVGPVLNGPGKGRGVAAFYRERFEAIVADLEACEGTVVAEGVDLLPEAVDGLGQGGRVCGWCCR